jgi:hypothetical protein
MLCVGAIGELALNAFGGLPSAPTNSEIYVAYFLGSSSAIIQYETLEISHPNFTQTFYVVRNSTNGLSAYLENGQLVNFTYYPMRVTPSSAGNDLDQKIQIEFGDLGELIPTQLDAVIANSGLLTKPVCKYRTYRSDLLSQVMYGPLVLEITTLAFNRTGVVFEASAPSLNIGKTGRVYSIDAFPTLRSFL